MSSPPGKATIEVVAQHGGFFRKEDRHITRAVRDLIVDKCIDFIDLFTFS